MEIFFSSLQGKVLFKESYLVNLKGSHRAKLRKKGVRGIFIPLSGIKLSYIYSIYNIIYKL